MTKREGEVQSEAGRDIQGDCEEASGDGGVRGRATLRKGKVRGEGGG